MTVVEGRTSPGPAYHDIFGADLSGHLKRFWWEPVPSWQGDDLTLVNGMQTHPTVGSETDATAHKSRASFSVFGFQGSSLIRYFSFRGQPWDAEDVTAGFGFNGSSGQVYGRPAAEFLTVVSYATPGNLAARYDVFARDSNDHLIHYWSFEGYRDYYRGHGAVPWQPGENLTTILDGIFIGSDPQVASRLSHGSSGTLDSQYVFARGSGQRSLVSYCWTPSESWSSHSLQSAVTPFGAYLGDDPAVVNGSTEGLSVYAQGETGDLIHYFKP